MADRISIPALREWAEAPFDIHAAPPGKDATLALVEAVEAAREASEEGRYSRLRSALARFDFGEGT